MLSDDSIKYSVEIKHVSCEDAISMIKEGENDYEQPLSQLINIELCAEKWSRLAKFLVVKNSVELVSLLVFYENLDTKMLYITHFVVSQKYKNRGVGKFVLRYLHDYAKTTKMSYVQLEVYSDSIAYKLYSNLNYRVIEDRNSKYLMQCDL